MSLRDALKVPNFNVLDFDFDEQAEGEAPFMKQVASAAQEIRPLTDQGTSKPSAADVTSSMPKPAKGAAGSSGSQAKKESILDDVDSDPEVWSLDEALKYRPSSCSLKGKGDASDVELKGLIYSSVGPDCFIDDEKDQVSSLPPSWFGPELMSFFRYADVFVDDMEIDPATADEKFVSERDIQNKDSVMDDLIARTFLFNISTPLDHARSTKIKNQDLGAAWVEAESVKEDLEKETIALKRKIHRTPDTEKKLAQLSQDLQAQKEKIKTLTTQNQSSQGTVVSVS
ncbi:hypothetical protein Hanom_Chr01g00058161 [Helianthus anomalus]